MIEQVLGSFEAQIRAIWEQGLGAMPGLVDPMINALIAGVVGLAALRAAGGHGGSPLVQAAIGSILTLVLGRTIIDHLGDLATWSGNTANSLAAVGGGETATPLSIARMGGELMERADDHANAQMGFLGLEFWNLPQSTMLVITGWLMLLAYVYVALIVLAV
jgi:hypothetical protein